jgi:hypothetical protein
MKTRKKRVQLQPTQYRMVTLITLDDEMQAKGATNITLGERAGVSDYTVSRARRRSPLKIFTAACILQALDTHEYRYRKRYTARPGKNQHTPKRTQQTPLQR